MATNRPSTFWDDLNRGMEHPDFRRAYVATLLEIRAVTAYMRTTGRMPSRRVRKRLRKSAKSQIGTY